MKLSELRHGAIYTLKNGLDVRCNIDSSGSEYWFTDIDGHEVRGSVFNVASKVARNDDRFKHRDGQ